MLLSYRAPLGTAPDLRPVPFPTLGITIPTGDFPTQYDGWRVAKAGAVVITLCLVAEADAPTGMGGVVKVRQTGGTLAAYLVETGDSNASPVRIKTVTGIKAIRLKT